MKKILLIEDEDRMRRVIRDYLTKFSYKIDEADTGRKGLEIFKNGEYDLILLDVMMPEMDGWSVCREIRRESKVPILMLTARSTETDELFGFELGVDDYLKKPFSLNILSARVKALITRNEISKNSVEDNLVFGELEINTASRRVIHKGKEVNLAPKEYELLLFLSINKGIAMSREKILNEVWDYSYFGDHRTVDTHVKKLRKKLSDEYIETVRSIGYRFEG